MNVRKRNGDLEPFDRQKIITAVQKAFLSCNYNVGINVIKEIVDNINVWNDINIEDIQDQIEEVLMDYDYTNVAKEYILYRYKHELSRKISDNVKFNNTIEEIVSGKTNEVTNENGNKNAKQFNVMRDLVAGEVCKKLYKELECNKQLLKLHNKGVIHIHDTDYRFMHGVTNCSLVNLEDMLQNGTVINGKLIEKPHSLRTATTIATQILTAVSSSQYGGVSITLAHLAPFVRISKEYYEEQFNDLPMNEKKVLVNKFLNKEIADSMQTLLYQLNSMTSTNGQSPFCTIFCYIHEDEEYIEENVALIKEVFKQRIKGMKGPNGNIINPAFPKLIYVLDEDNINSDTKYYDVTKLAAECTCKRMVPDYISAKIMKKYKEGNVFPSMGCRSFLHPWKDKDGKYKFWGRNNIGVISINLPYLALDSKDYNDFLNKLDNIIDKISAEQNKIFNQISNVNTEVAPILWNYGAFARLPVGSKIGEAIKDGYCSASIGYAGLAECVYHFGIEYGTKEGQKLGLDIMKHMYDRTNINKEKYHLALSLYGTPMEATTTKFANALKQFPIEKHVNDRDYITNSYHIPVEYKIDGYSKIEFEAPFQEYSSGGSISYVECPDIRKNPEAVLNIMKCIYDNMMYCELNTTSCDVCYTCGYEGEIHMDNQGNLSCPNCGETDRHKLYAERRLCGYIGILTNGISKGRIADINNRVKHF
nr:MAG TPA: anaerobic ribonucleoside triphosphate reductase [Caudoviricetes sp.]